MIPYIFPIRQELSLFICKIPMYEWRTAEYKCYRFEKLSRETVGASNICWKIISKIIDELVGGLEK